MARQTVPIPQSIPAPDTTKQTKQNINDLISHIARGDNHLWQALGSLQNQANGMVANISLICYGPLKDLRNSDPNKVGQGSLWFVTDLQNAVYQVRVDPVDNKLKWFYATGTVYVPPNSTFNPVLGAQDAGLLVAMHGYLMAWDGIGPQLTCQIFGPCAGGTTGGNTGGGSSSGGSGGGGSGTGGSGPGSTNPIPPNTVVAGNVGNFQVGATTINPDNTVTATFTWSLPTVNPDLYAGVQLWIVGGTTVSEICSGGPTDTSCTAKIPFPSLGVAPLVVMAITVDKNIGVVADPSTQNGQAGPTVIWNTGTGGMDPGHVQNLVVYPSTVNPDGSFSAIVGWDNGLLTIFASGVQVWLIASSGGEPVPRTLAGVSGQGQNIPTSVTVSAPASAAGEQWTLQAVAINSVGTPSSSPSQAPTRVWNVGS